MQTSQSFFRLIWRTALLAGFALLLLSAWFPAPLREAADIRKVPNPVKASWFLVWMQEILSYSLYFAYLILAVGILFLTLPYLPGHRAVEQARWFPRDQKAINWFTGIVFLAIIILTVIAIFFRGENWRFIV